jgi:predicted metalloprotease with PDZ domain
MADDFVRVRLIKITGADLNLFEFDYDLTWVAFFLNADECVYGRYGGRDASGPDARLSLAGLRYAMQAALTTHRQPSSAKPAPRPAQPLLAENYPAAKARRNQECIHCHQVYEYRRAADKASGTFRREALWVYPLPENIGLTLEVDRGDRLKAVSADSPAAWVGLRAGDRLRKVNEVSIASFADLQHALNRAPANGRVPITWESEGNEQRGQIELADGWRKTNITWRPSMLDIMPSLTLFGEDLTPAEKKSLGLDAKRLAFRQDKNVPSDLRAIGLRGGDVVIGVDGQVLQMTVLEFLAHVRRNYLVGDRMVLNALRDGQPVDFQIVLK